MNHFFAPSGKNFSAHSFELWQEKRLCFETARTEKPAECAVEKNPDAEKTKLKTELQESTKAKELVVAEIKIQLDTLAGTCAYDETKISTALQATEEVKDDSGNSVNGAMTGDKKNILEESEVSAFVDHLTKTPEKPATTEAPTENQKIQSAVDALTNDPNADVSNNLEGIKGSEFQELSAEMLQKLFLVKNGENFTVNFRGSQNAYLAIGMYDFFKDKTLNTDFYIQKGNVVGRFGVNQNTSPDFLQGKLGFLSPEGSYLGIKTGDTISAPKTDLADQYKKAQEEMTKENEDAILPTFEKIDEAAIKTAENSWRNSFAATEKDPAKMEVAEREYSAITGFQKENFEIKGEYPERALAIAKACNEMDEFDGNFVPNVKENLNLVTAAEKASIEFPNVPFEGLVVMMISECSFREGKVEGDKNMKHSAHGVLQVRQPALDEVLAKHSNEDIFKNVKTPADLHETEQQVFAGAAYLEILLGRNHGNLHTALTRYNGSSKYADKVLKAMSIAKSSEQ